MRFPPSPHQQQFQRACLRGRREAVSWLAAATDSAVLQELDEARRVWRTHVCSSTCAWAACTSSPACWSWRSHCMRALSQLLLRGLSLLQAALQVADLLQGSLELLWPHLQEQVHKLTERAGFKGTA